MAGSEAGHDKSLNIRVAAYFLVGARCRQSTVARRTDILGITRQRTGLEARRLGPERLAALRQFGVRQFHIHDALFGIDHYDVAVLDQTDGPHVGSLRPDMADAQSARR